MSRSESGTLGDTEMGFPEAIEAYRKLLQHVEDDKQRATDAMDWPKYKSPNWPNTNRDTLAPDREWSLFGAAQMAGRLGRSEEAVTFWLKAITLNPWNWEYHDELARLCADRQNWKNAAEQCQEALKLNMAALETRTLLVKCFLRLRQTNAAQREFETLLAFEPPDPEALRRWFAEENR